MTASKDKFLDERIMVLHGVGMVELAGDYYVVGSGSLVECKGGVPHTWTACPAGVRMPDGSVSEGGFTMVYEYEEETSFFPTGRKEVCREVTEYEAWEGELEEIRFPEMSKEEAVGRCKGVVWDGVVREVRVSEDEEGGILKVN